MGKERALIFVLTIPYFLIAFFIRCLKIKSLVYDYNLCLQTLNKNSFSISIIKPPLVECLRIAEDHRQLLHFGIDPIAILRTIYLRSFKGVRQGASTIEQQFVRTITKRYEKTVRRKIREQVLAIWIRGSVHPDTICRCYISCCYYGYGTYGIKKLIQKHPDADEYYIVSRIKYPFRKIIDLKTECKFNNRMRYLKELSFKNKCQNGIFLRKN
ncbi:transglycosylase domain-containing protein [Cedecea sp.]|jgi:penicillin-binding protein 1A|uniref:transglycosylase domain-containing protein n=1 Tax=Cedecea sp. TaxID=1970739 RepID=UPI002F3E4E01